MDIFFMGAVFQCCFQKPVYSCKQHLLFLTHNFAWRQHDLSSLSKNALPVTVDRILYFQIKKEIIFLLVVTC